MYLMMLMVTTTARSSLTIFFFSLISLLLFTFSVIGTEWREAEREKAGNVSSPKRCHIGARVHVENKPEEATSSLSLSLFALMLQFVEKEKHTQGLEKVGPGVMLGPISWLHLTEHVFFFLSQ